MSCEPADASEDGSGLGQEIAEPEAVDPAELQAQLDDIRAAMGLAEQYPAQGRIWLAYGGLVGGFAIALQVLFVVEIPEWGYSATWVVFALLGLGSIGELARRTRRGDRPPAAPDWLPVVGGLLPLLFTLTWIAQPVVTAADVPGVVEGSYFFAMAIAVGGLGFLVVGTMLQAYRIRRRDRWVFYAGGLWMLVFAGVFPNVEWFRYGGYGVFGILTLLQALTSYVLVTRG